MGNFKKTSSPKGTPIHLWATAPSPPSVIKVDSSSTFVVSAFVSASLPLPHGRLSAFMAQNANWISSKVENPNFRPHHYNFHRISALTAGLAATRPNLRGVD
ncbi:hypothetical protein AVEN_188861-1 [Araneus ventricosus]|uniref:Uncharacterized protein n=1 Tax=Araneus ventricosus TaxID=182803 RepID=A0A4Y2RK92_ARAVE|nr:hypothetical protein AVEN_188861-1 [Araneus ventricosus]